MSLLSKGVSAAQLAAAQKESLRKAMELASGVVSETEPQILPGEITQYWRGDKTWQYLTKESVGLDNVDNTADADKPISTATAAALAGKEPTIAAGTTAQFWRGDKSWQALVAITTISTNADATVTSTAQTYQVFHTGTLTADRTMTLETAGMITGYVIRFTRTGSGAFNLIIGGLKNLATNTWCDVMFNGSAWVLTAYGTL